MNKFAAELIRDFRAAESGSASFSPDPDMDFGEYFAIRVALRLAVNVTSKALVDYCRMNGPVEDHENNERFRVGSGDTLIREPL